jgi:putative glycosyltransferase (TIGR04372 family)
MKFLRLLVVPFAGLAVIFMRLVKPWWHIRIGVMFSDRIGHLAGNSEVYLCERDAGMHKSTDIWITKDKVANTYLLKMLKRCMTIDTSGFWRIVCIINNVFHGSQHEIGMGSWDRDVLNLMEKSPTHLKFTAAEEERGRKTLRAWGIPDKAKWVCLIVRDAAYLPELTYHEYRDSDIDSYKLAALELARRGYYVFRMGVKVAKPFNVNHPNIIDFASDRYSDFMSLYLGAKCEFCVSTGCGFDAIPYVFRRPICYVNYVPVEYLFTFAPKSLAIWKHHYKDGRRMTLEEIYKSGAGKFMSSEQFKEAGITLQDNTPEEIRDAVVEMANGAAVHWRDELENSVRQKAFWKDFPRSISEYTNRPLHGEIRMRIGHKFLCDQYS